MAKMVVGMPVVSNRPLLMQSCRTCGVSTSTGECGRQSCGALVEVAEEEPEDSIYVLVAAGVFVQVGLPQTGDPGLVILLVVILEVLHDGCLEGCLLQLANTFWVYVQPGVLQQEGGHGVAALEDGEAELEECIGHVEAKGQIAVGVEADPSSSLSPRTSFCFTECDRMIISGSTLTYCSIQRLFQ